MGLRERLLSSWEKGYWSGNIHGWWPNGRRRRQEKKAGCSYRRLVRCAIKPFVMPTSVVLELGPGKGSWSRAILNLIPRGRLVTVDLVDTAQWLHPEDFPGRLKCHRTRGTDYDFLSVEAFDFCWSFGVLCHIPLPTIEVMLRNLLPKMKRGGQAVHQHAEWQKLEAFGWERSGTPAEFRVLPDDEIWWPRNTTEQMAEAARRAGWTVVTPDLGLMTRDGLIHLRRDR